ncbi:hypothetical protein PsYK624_002770 [Phanerochaete sordida]|uniref:RRN7-type domain-containing protein n=1 Tax=Phanerochaete sordida TaxID=48140 RepID=A0A9P3FX35_9APHY|nr:hypothetical protein PsYK624_002770 [Phanerochaete sordida]
MAPRQRCAVCGSKQWRKEPSSGLITCSEGHVLQSYRNETTEVTELGPHQMRKRAFKSSRKKKEWQSKADPKLYHGERARYHYYQCQQLLLRLQAAALITAWKLPPEFEVVCRDVWALHLSLLPSPPAAEPYFHVQSQYGGQAAAEAPQTDKGELSKAGDKPPPKGSGDEDAESTASSSTEEEEDLDMDELLKENSEAPSSSEDDDGDESRPRARQDRRRKDKTTFRPYDSPAANIAVLMLACWTLRLPVMYMDFKRLIESYDLPYLDPLRLLPETMTLHLTKHTARALSPQFPPTPLHVHGLTSRLAKLVYRSHGILTPECNAAPLLWRATRALEGTPTLYFLAKKLGKIVSLTLTLHHSLSPALNRARMRDPEHHKYDNAPPEVALIAMVIVVLKMTYGLDGTKRVPQSADDPACALPNLPEYLAALQSAGKSEQAQRAAFFDTAPESLESVLDMDEAEMDKYIAFCQKALLPPEDRRAKNPVLDEFFPLSEAPLAAHPDPAAAAPPPAHAPAKPLPATRLREASADLRPGQAYRIYNSHDVLGALPGDCALLLRRAAQWAGVDEHYVAGVVERYERRVLRWWRTARAAAADKAQDHDKAGTGVGAVRPQHAALTLQVLTSRDGMQ